MKEESEQELQGNPDEDSENLDFLQAKQKRFEVELDSAPIKKRSKIGKILMLILIVVLVIAVLTVLGFMFFG
jgi:hypothetical protein